MGAHYGRCRTIRNIISLMLYLAGGWRSYQEISEEFGWKFGPEKDGVIHYKTAYRNVRSLDDGGLPVEYNNDVYPKRMHLPSDWVARTPWLRRYIIRKEPLKAVNQKAAQARSLHK